jgi:uncharacterized membrane protein
MSETAVFILIGCFFLFFIALEVVMLIIGHKRAAEYTLEKAHKEIQDESNNWVITLVAGVVGDVIAWFWLGSRISRAAFIFVLICVDLLLLLLAAIEYDTKRMAKKKIRESEQKGIEQQGDDHRL